MTKYSGRRTRAGLPDRRTREGKAWFRRSEAAKRAAETRRERKAEAERKAAQDRLKRKKAAEKGWKTRRARKEKEEWPIGRTSEIIIEEPIETVGGPRKKSGRRRK
jgi:hypothetical protein